MDHILKGLAIFFSALLVFITPLTAQPSEEQVESELQRIVVTSERQYDKFGSEITEQSYYRTGGDVTVIDRRDIEDNHYQNITEAIKRVPGVQVSGTGHHANVVGMTGSGPNYSNELSINGDNNVIILIDGIRIGNEAMDVGGLGGGARAMLNMITAIDNVEKIEVIKGSSASIYGADATGGLINIITRKGSAVPVTSVNMAGGSWRSYNLSAFHSGSAKDGRTRYFFGGSRERSGDTKYKDAETGKSVRFLNSYYKDDAVIFRIERDLTPLQSGSFSYAHIDSIAGNPTTAPEFSTLARLWTGDLYNDRGLGYAAPGYRNWFYLGALYGSFVKTQSNQYTFQYIFTKDHEIPSFIRLFVERSRIGVMDYAGNGGLMNKPPAIYMDPAAIANILRKRRLTQNTLNNMVLDFQYAKTLGRHSVITGLEFRKNDYRWIRTNNNGNNGSFDVTGTTMIDSNRDIFYFWVQDKIEVTDSLTITPGLRYSYYSDIKSNYDGDNRSYDGASKMTYNLQANYMFDSSASMYFSVSNVFRPVTYMEFDSETPLEKLKNEKGMNWSLGFEKKFSNTTAADINLSYLDMSNAIARYPVWDDAAARSVTRSVNATQKKRALNLGLSHNLTENWKIRASYSYVFEKFKAKNWHIEPILNGTTIDEMINAYRPANIYQIDLSFASQNWNANIWTDIRSGLDQKYFTGHRFVVMGLNVNWQISPHIKLFATADNLTNTAYETKARSFFGKGAYPQPGRSFMFGTQTTF
jgi:iron complex outermembrane receptor protein